MEPSAAAMKKLSAMDKFIGLPRTNWITGAPINRKESGSKTRSFVPHKRTDTGKLKPNPEPQDEIEVNTKAETKAETKDQTAERLGLGLDKAMTEDNDDFTHEDNFDSDDLNSDDDDDGFNGNLDSDPDSNPDSDPDSDQNTNKDPTKLVFTSKNNVYFDGHGYARRVGKENKCYIEFSTHENTLVINQFICLNGGKLLLYHMIKDLEEEKGYVFTNIMLIAANLNPNPVNPALFDKDIFNQQNFEKDNEIFIEMQDLKYIDKDGNFTKKYHDMIPNGYIEKYTDDEDRVRYRFTSKYYRHMKRKIIQNYEDMGFEAKGNGEFKGTKEEIEATLESILGIRGGTKKRKTKRRTKHNKKTKRRTNHNKKTKRRTVHYKKTKRRTKK